MNDPEMSALGVDLRVEAGFQHVEEVKSEETCREKSHVCAKARFPANDLLALQPDTAPRQSHNANSTANVHQRNACAEARDDCRHYRHRVPSHCQRSCVRSLPITYHWASITGQERTYTFALNESERFDGIGIRVFHANLHLHRPLHHGGRLER